MIEGFICSPLNLFHTFRDRGCPSAVECLLAVWQALGLILRATRANPPPQPNKFAFVLEKALAIRKGENGKGTKERSER